MRKTFPAPTFEYIHELDVKEDREREQRLLSLKKEIETFLSKDGDQEVKKMLTTTLEKVNLMLKGE